MLTPTFFKTPAEFRAWFAKHAANESELIVAFYKRGSGHASITWPELVDEALCVGWIDGVRTRIDDEAYKIRFTPRKTTSTWSAINIERVRVLTGKGRMTDAGQKAFCAAARGQIQNLRLRTDRGSGAGPARRSSVSQAQGRVEFL